MKTWKGYLSIFILGVLWTVLFISCEKEENDAPDNKKDQFVSLTSPYLICASRNPGGVGFDFEYKGEKGGANNLDAPTVKDFEFDVKIRTIKGEKPDGTLGGAPYIQLSAKTKAVNYSAIDNGCTGISDFRNLNQSNIQEYLLQSDNPSFDLSKLTVGSTGSPLMQQLMQEYNKLIIGQRWKEAANNEIADDEPIWIIQTKEGKTVKFIVTDFPADPAPAKTGYIAVSWDFVD
ncbi:MAG: hypothetical protein PHP34_07385 [Bacteroidales bacterium]|nr:hypothetical protein [Bacteroidales bacterium]MDD4713134.1 hypothetical protein [Bacteroidales bacterium]